MNGVVLEQRMSGGIMFGAFITSVLGSATALQLMSYRTGLSGLKNHCILALSSVMFGLVSVWTLHFCAMLALEYYDPQLQTTMDMRFDESLTVASLFIAIATGYVGLRIVGDPKTQSMRQTRWRIAIAGFAGALSVAGMHFCGVGSLKMQADLEFDTGRIALTVFIADVTVTTALWLFFVKTPDYLGTRKWLWFWFISSIVMGGAVTAVHSCGMWASKFTTNYMIPRSSFSRLPDSTTLLSAILPINAISLLLLGYMIYLNRRYHLSAAQKAQSLILSVVMMNNKGQVLATLANQLPNVSIETAYQGRGIFSQHNADFARMLKTSFNWHSVHEYHQQIRELCEQKEISEYSLQLYQKFLSAAHEVAAGFNINISQLPFCYWNPSHSMVTLIMKSKTGNMITDVYTREVVKWCAPEEVYPFLREKLNTGQDPSTWLQNLYEYQERCNMPMTGEWSSDRLNDMFRKVMHELRIDKEEVEQEVQVCRTTLGRYVKTRQHLVTLVQSPEWTQVSLPLMIKAQLKNMIDRLTQHGTLATGGNGNVAELMRLNAAEDSVSTLYLGMYYLQATGNGMQVLLQQQGPYRMLPMVKFTRQQVFTQEIISWLKALCDNPELTNQVLSKLRHQRAQSHTGPQQPPPATGNADAPAPKPSADANNDMMMRSHRRTLSQKEVLQNLQNAVDGMGPATSRANRRSQFMSMRAPSLAKIILPPPTPTATTTAVAAVNSGAPPTSNTPPSPHQANLSSTSTTDLIAAAAAGTDSPLDNPLYTESPTLTGFIQDFINGCKLLGNQLGTDKDLTPQALDGVHILPIANDLTVLMFVVVNLSMPPVFPPDYASSSLFFVPLTHFEIIHFSQHLNSIDNTRPAHGGSSSYENWTRNLIKSQLANNETALIRPQAVSADRDMVFSNPVHSLKNSINVQQTPSSSGGTPPAALPDGNTPNTYKRHLENRVPPLRLSDSLHTIAVVGQHRRPSSEINVDVHSLYPPTPTAKVRVVPKLMSARRHSFVEARMERAEFKTAQEAAEEENTDNFIV